MTLASWCGKVISDMERRRSARLLISSLMPKDEPMIKFTVEYPLTLQLSSFWDNSSLDICFPSMHMAMLNAPLLLRYGSISFASFCKAVSFCFSDGSSGSFDSPSSITSSLQNAPSRFEYSATASRQYCSLSFPTVIRFILIKMPPPFLLPRA